MIGLLCFVLAVLASPFKSKMRLEAENAVLRHQLIVLRRKLRGRVQLANSDRGVLSGAPTPGIDRLASEGMHLLNVNVAAQCTPLQSALTTGRFSNPRRHLRS